MTVDIMCQEDRLMTPFRHEIIPHTPFITRGCGRRDVFFATMGRSQGAPVRAMINALAEGTLDLGLLLDICDMGGPNQYEFRLLRGFVKAPQVQFPDRIP